LNEQQQKASHGHATSRNIFPEVVDLDENYSLIFFEIAT